MIERIRTLVEPETEHLLPIPTPSEALAKWLLGTLWAGACVALGSFTPLAAVPALLVAGLVALWGWRQEGWLSWFPAVLVLSSLGDVVSPLPAVGGRLPLSYVDIVSVGVVIVALARAVAVRRTVAGAMPAQRMVLAAIALCVLGLTPDPGRVAALLTFRHGLLAVTVLYAAATVAARPGGERWIWAAFPLATALLGVHALSTGSLGLELLAAHARAADAIWRASESLPRALLVALPVTLTLAVCERRLRVLYGAAAVCGALGVGYHVAAGSQLADPLALDRLRHPLQAGLVLLKLMALAALFFMCFSSRPPLHATPLDLGLAATFVVLAALELTGGVGGALPVQLAGLAAGIAVGRHRHTAGPLLDSRNRA